jgi:CelD/BcsL family acetyltransferase involved in cellulose biosynthesis
MTAPIVDEPTDVEWDTLVDRCGGGPFVRPGWTRAWRAAFAPTTPLEIVAVRSDAGELTGLAAVLAERGGLSSLVNDHTPAVTILAIDDASGARVTDLLFARRPHRLLMAPLAADSPAHGWLRDAARRHRYRLAERTVLRSPYLELTAGQPAEENLSRGMRKELRRSRRRLDELGALELVIAQTPAELASALPACLELEASQWKGAAGSAITARPDTDAFYRAIAAWGAQTGRLRLAQLHLDGRPVAFEIDLFDGGRLFALKAGFAPDLAKYGLGHLLVSMLFAEMQPQGLRAYEMLGDADPYKLKWTDTCRQMIRVEAFSLTPRGLAGLARVRVGRPLARRARRAVERLRRHGE